VGWQTIQNSNDFQLENVELSLFILQSSLVAASSLDCFKDHSHIFFISHQSVEECSTIVLPLVDLSYHFDSIIKAALPHAVSA
jgi:hypothetical protein